MGANHSQSFITEHQVAELLAVSVTTVRKWRLQRRGPAFVKVEGSVRYCADDIAEYIRTRRVCGEAVSERPTADQQEALTLAK